MWVPGKGPKLLVLWASPERPLTTWEPASSRVIDPVEKGTEPGQKPQCLLYSNLGTNIPSLLQSPETNP